MYVVIVVVETLGASASFVAHRLHSETLTAPKRARTVGVSKDSYFKHGRVGFERSNRQTVHLHATHHNACYKELESTDDY